MIISIINNTDMHRQEIQNVLRAVDRQLTEDFRKYWHKDVQLRLEGWTGEQPDPDLPLDMRGDAVIYLWDDNNIDDALGYHDLNYSGVPYGFVFTELAKTLGEDWSVTLSHEALELAIDPEINLLAQGPHPDPAQNGRLVYHWYELCDAVQADTYEIDGVKVSNFVLPLYFTESDEHENHNDFLGLSLPSFQLRPGGYIGYFDPETGRHENYFGDGDQTARARMEAKASYVRVKRSGRRDALQGEVNDVCRVACESISFELSGAPARLPIRAASIVRELLGSGWKFQRCSADPTEFDAVYTGQKPLCFSDAWQQCHELSDIVDIVWAEPSFVHPIPGAMDLPVDDIRVKRRSSVFGEEHKKGTEDPLWALEQCRVKQAWDYIVARGGQPGQGVLIGHPDSGLLKHRELDTDRVRLDLDWDFQNSDDDAITKKSKDGNHGLSTASVIVSGTEHIVQGAAPHAELIPLRVTKPGLVRPTPVLLSGGMRRLRDAVDYAVGQGCHVISMSLGGLGHKGLHKALRRATEAGVIVLAAAGNQVKFVVWPARYPETIAVAGSNIDRKKWKGSSRGKAVDITAPGESVWRARIKKSGEESEGPGSGTSYSVAITAGVAALWRSYHAEALKNYEPAVIPELFRVLVTESASKDHKLPAKKFGSGILDAEALLRVPLPEDVPTRRRPTLDDSVDSEIRGRLRRQSGTTSLTPQLKRELMCADLLEEILDATVVEPMKGRREKRKKKTSAGLSPRLTHMLRTD